VSKQPGKLFIVSGPSGVGKTTIVMKFLQQYQDMYKIDKVITYTTKNPRSTEVNGVDYYFISEVEFELKIKSEFFLEWSGEYGALYGTPSSVIAELASGASKILVIDRAGAVQIMNKYPAVILVWIEVSSISLLLDRLLTRKTESPEQVQTRFLLAQKEVMQEKNESIYHYRIENDDLAQAIKSFFDIVMKVCV